VALSVLGALVVVCAGCATTVPSSVGTSSTGTSGTAASSTTSSTTTSVPHHARQWPARVAFFGDSLSSEAGPYYKQIIASLSPKTALVYDTFGGTAICDWFSAIDYIAVADHPNVVELEFSGNTITACVRHYIPGSLAYDAKYRADAETVVRFLEPRGIRVVFVGVAITRSQRGVPNWEGLDTAYAQVAAAHPGHVGYVDAGAAVEGPGHTYTRTLPCLKGQPCTGPVVNGVRTNIVRAPDGVHFCPVATGSPLPGGCPVYSSGAYRFARSMVEALATGG
jgi:hypothetical protein